MPTYQARYLYGPCNGRRTTLFFSGAPSKEVTCRGAKYRLEPSIDPATLAYVLASADVIVRPGEVVDQRDVFRSWARLHRALNQTTRKEVLRVRAASRRIRRAVR